MKLSEFTSLFSTLEHTKGTNNKIDLLKAHVDDVFFLSLLTMPNINVGDRTIIKALSSHTGYTENEIQAELILDGRLSEVVTNCIKNKKIKPLSQFFSITPTAHQDPELSYVYSRLMSLKNTSSYSEQSNILQEIFHTTSSPYLINIITGDRALGISYRNIFKAFPNPEKVSRTFALCNNWFITITNPNLETPILNSPVSPQLCVSSNLSKIKSKKISVENKYDGVRIQPHISKTNRLYTRKQEDVTNSLPDVIDELFCFQSKNNIRNAIFDAEMIPFHTREGKKIYLDQKEAMTRLGKHNIHKKVRAVSLELIIFDVLYMNDISLIDHPYSYRRKVLESLFTTPNIKLSHQKYIDNIEDITTFYHEAILEHEGVIVKPPDSTYHPGQRKDWLKIKPTIPSFDLVITKAYHGKGQKAQLYSSFEISAQDGDDFIAVGKVANGFTIEELEKLTKIINSNPHGTTPHYIEILNPNIIVETECENVNYIDNKISFDFTRVIRIRDDKRDITTIDEIKKYVKKNK